MEPVTPANVPEFPDLTAEQQELLQRHHQLSQELLVQGTALVRDLFRQWDGETDPGPRNLLTIQIRELLRHHAALDDFAVRRGERIFSVDFDSRAASHWFGESAPEYQRLNERLFSQPSTHHLTAVWIEAALSPKCGDQTVTMQEARQQWRDSMAGRQRSRFYLSSNDFNRHPELPVRVTVRQNGRSRQGWNNMLFQPEAGNAAMDRLEADLQLGRALHQAGAYPWEIASVES